jgi:iron complex outermembrane receptor protein
VPAYTTLDASIAREIRGANGVPLELRLTGENLLGRHQELANYPEQRKLGDKPLNKLDPQIYLSLSARF